MLELADQLDRNRSQGLRHVLAECFEGIIAVFAQPVLHRTPKVLDEIDFAVKLGQENANVPYIRLSADMRYVRDGESHLLPR